MFAWRFFGSLITLGFMVMGILVMGGIMMSVIPTWLNVVLIALFVLLIAAMYEYIKNAAKY